MAPIATDAGNCHRSAAIRADRNDFPFPSGQWAWERWASHKTQQQNHLSGHGLFDYSPAFLPAQHWLIWPRLDKDPAGWLFVWGFSFWLILMFYFGLLTFHHKQCEHSSTSPLPCWRAFSDTWKMSWWCLREARGLRKMKTRHFYTMKRKKWKQADVNPRDTLTKEGEKGAMRWMETTALWWQQRRGGT